MGNLLNKARLLLKRMGLFLLKHVLGRQECPLCKKHSVHETDYGFLPNKYKYKEVNGVLYSKTFTQLKCGNKACDYQLPIIGDYPHLGMK